MQSFLKKKKIQTVFFFFLLLPPRMNLNPQLTCFSLINVSIPIVHQWRFGKKEKKTSGPIKTLIEMLLYLSGFSVLLKLAKVFLVSLIISWNVMIIDSSFFCWIPAIFLKNYKMHIFSYFMNKMGAYSNISLA